MLRNHYCKQRIEASAIGRKYNWQVLANEYYNFKHVSACANPFDVQGAFERLSGDLGAYMRMVQEGLLLCVLATLASIPAFILNFNGAGGPIGTYNRWMSIGVAAELSWGHVLSQAVVSCMCLYYIRRQRSYLIDTQMQKNKVARRFVDAARKQRKLRDRMRAVLKRGGRAGWSFGRR